MSSSRIGRDPVAASTKRPRAESTSRRTDVNASTSTRRKKSRSRSPRRADPFTLPPAPPKAIKKTKSHGALALNVERERERSLRNQTPTVPPPTSHKHRMRKENAGGAVRGKDADRDMGMDASVYSSALAMAENERQREMLKQEVETLKHQMHEGKKALKKQKKVIQELRDENSTGALARKDQEAQIETMKSKTRQTDEVIASIETALQCQICMELLMKPYALSPCGHVLCLPCLQEWFRKAPPSADDMDIDPQDYSDPQYIMHRTKSCPCCRATVLHRPVEVFLVKGVVQALIRGKSKSHKEGTPVSREDGSSTVDGLGGDVWEGLFPNDEDVGMLGDEDEDEDEYDEGEYEHIMQGALRRLPVFGPGWVNQLLGRDEEEDGDNQEYDSFSEEDHDMGSASDSASGSSVGDGEDEEMGVWVLPMWERPCVHYRGGARQNASVVKMMRRGATREMIQTYRMSYEHDKGLCVRLRDMDPEAAVVPVTEREREIETNQAGVRGGQGGYFKVYVGWTVRLELGDRGGHAYVNEMLHEYLEHPERFVRSRSGVGLWEVKRLVRVEELQELEDGDTTDSDTWHELL